MKIRERTMDTDGVDKAPGGCTKSLGTAQDQLYLRFQIQFDEPEKEAPGYQRS